MVAGPLAACRRHRSRHGRNRRRVRRLARPSPAAARSASRDEIAGRVSTISPSAIVMALSDCGTASGSTGAPAQKMKPLLSLSATQRSCQAFGRAHELPHRQRIDELVGDEDERALRQILDALAPLQRGRGGRATSFACVSRSTGLVSTSAMVMLSSSPGTRTNTRSASAISVPRPGPSSAKTTAGSPMACHTAAAQTPSSSPNTWLISGAVTKSPSRADRLARRVIAGTAVGEAGLHIVMHADRPVARDPLFQPCRKRRLFGAVEFALRAHHDDAKAGCRLARQISHAPTRIMGME